MLDLARSGAARSLHTTFSVHGILDRPDLVCNGLICMPYMYALYVYQAVHGILERPDMVCNGLICMP